MYSTFGAPSGARANGGQSGVDSATVRPTLPLKGGGFGGYTGGLHRKHYLLELEGLSRP